MKKRKVWIVLLVLALVVSGLFSPAFLQASATANTPAKAEVAAPVVAKTDLSTKVANFYAPDFTPLGAKKAPVNTVLFTAEELKKTGSNRITQTRGKFFVTTKKLDPATKAAKVVPIEEYVAQLNGYEMYLNKLGYSLRSGPPNLGKILTLIKKRPTSLPGGDRRVGGKQLFFDPTIYERSGAVRGNKIYPEYRLGKGQTNPSGLTTSAQIQGSFNKALAPREIALPTGTAGTGSRVLKTESMCPCVSCGNSPPPPASGLNGICLSPLCPAADGLSCVKCAGGSSSPSIQSSTSLGTFCGEKSAICKASKCLYDGYLAGQWTGLSKCISATDGNDWFDASLCLELSASNCGMNKKLNLRNSGSLHSELKIFGFSIPILDIAATAVYNDGQPGQESEFKFLDQTVETLKFEQTIPGPGATFPIGPIPVTISSELYFLFDVGTPNFTFPSKLNPNNCNAVDTLNVGVGVTLKSHIGLKAYVNAVVAKVGVEGQLILADDYFGVGLPSTINPAKNEVLIQPGLQYRLKHLAGKLFLFAEIDVIVYSKRFEVQIFDFESGLGTNGQLVKEPFTQKSFGAVDLSPKS